MDVESYERLKREALTRKPDAPQEQSAAPAGEGAPAAAAEPPATGAAPAAEPEPEPTEEGSKAPDRVRLGRLTDDGEKRRIATAVQFAADEGITFTEAWTRLNGTAPTAAPTGGANGATPATEPPAAENTAPQVRSREDIQRDLEALDADYEKAGNDMDTAAMVKLRKRERELNGELEQVKTAEQTAAQQFEAQADASAREAVTLYPDAAVKGSALHSKAAEIEERLAATNNPLLNQPDAPLRIAQMAANELNIPPADPKKPKSSTSGSTSTITTPAERLSTSTATKPAPVNQTAVVRPTSQPAAAPASGAARTNHNGNGQGQVVIGPIKSVHDYDALKEKLGLRA